MNDNYKRDRDCKETDKIEIKALIGLLYFSGLLNRKFSVSEMWDRKETGVEIFWLTMSKQRFLFLLKHLRFDDPHFRFDNAADRGERNTTDYSAAIAWVFKSFEIKNCQLCYSIEYNECIYEMLVGFRELCKSRTYMSNKSK
ncbi:hypothetical protein HUJ04_001453 [Dendroctonus ponderosae]|nr:hypothetical protein HUJ04_001453 [Dendroctonus ponderosae]